MAETIKEILSQSFKLWRSNLSIAGAYVLNSIISTVIMALGVGIMAWRMLEYIPTELIKNLNFLTNEEVFGQFMEALFAGFVADNNWLIFIVLTLVVAVVVVFISTFFTAGITGMCKEANEKGKTGFSDLMKYGKNKFINLFIGYIIYLIIAFILIFILSMAFGLLSLIMAIVLSFMPSSIALFLGVLAGFIFTLIVTYIAMIFIYPLYATVVEEKGAIDSFGLGIRFILNNLKDASLLVIIYALISAIMGILMDPNIIGIKYIGILVVLINVIFTILMILLIGPIFQIAFVRIYMERTNKYIRRQ